MRSAEAKTRALADGKAAMVARLVWQLQVGDMAFRCLRQPNGTFEVQSRTKSWRKIGAGADAALLLRKIVASKVMQTCLSTQAGNPT